MVIPMKLNFILLSIIISYSCFAFSGMYKQVDEHGNVTYSNVRSLDAKEVDLPSIIVVPSADSDDIDARIKNRLENTRNNEQRETIERQITEESNRLDKIKKEYKGGAPDRLGSERNYQRYLDRVERLKEEISVREKNLHTLKYELQNLPDSGR